MKKMLQIILVMMTAMFLVTPIATAQSTCRKYSPQLLAAAQSGNAKAQYDLANCFYSGNLGVAKDTVKALEWESKAVDQKYIPAMLDLNWRYLLGRGVPTDTIKSRDLLMRATQLGSAKAYCILGDNYRFGNGGYEENEEMGHDMFKKAVVQYKKDAEAGDISALHEIGDIYAHGYMGKADTTEAIIWYKKSAAAGVYQSQHELGCIYRDRGEYGDAFLYLKKTVNNPKNTGKYGAADLGECYYNGWGTPRNYVEAVRLWRMTITNNNDTFQKAHTGLGLCYLYGHGVPKNENEAVKYIQAAADNLWGWNAKYFMGLLCYEGRGVEQNYKKAFDYFMKASIYNRYKKESYFYIGNCYYLGEGVDENKSIGMHYYEDSAKMGYVPAMLRLADCYVAEGKQEDAIQWYSEVSQSKTPEGTAAAEALAKLQEKQKEPIKSSMASSTSTSNSDDLLYKGVYTVTGWSYGYSAAQYTNTGIADLKQVEIYRSRIVVDGKSIDYWKSNGQWLWYGQSRNHPIYLYNPTTGELRFRLVFNFYGEHVSDNFWVRGDQVAAYTGNATSSKPAYSTQSGSTTTSSSSSTLVTKTCGYCNGRGWVPTDEGVATFGNNNKKWCQECREYVYMNHWHKTCPNCKGKGTYQSVR